MKTIEIVTHAWAGKYPHYAQALSYQLSSLILHRPKTVDVVVTICHEFQDQLVSDVIDFFDDKLDLDPLALSLPDLGRRAIGRNITAQTTSTDIVWFTDVDYVFGEGCLDTLAKMPWPEWCSMMYPQHCQIHKDHATGDMALAKAETPQFIDVDPSEFVTKRYSRAIGGIQIVQGDFARKHGYVRNSVRWQQPYTGPRGFDSCRCDKPYRRFCGEQGSIIPIELPNLYRIRHSQASHHD